MKIGRILLCLVGTLAFAARADAQVLYASTSAGNPGELFTINPANGSMLTDIGPLSDTTGVNYPVTGLAFNPATGLLYGSTGNSVVGTAARLITVNPANAQVTVIGSFNAGPVSGTGTPATMADLAFNPVTGTLYGVGSIGGPQLYTIDPATGQATLVGPSGLTSTGGGGLAINALGAAFGTPSSSRYGTYDLTTGTYVNITNPTKPAGGAYAALAFDASGTLFGLNSGTTVGGITPTHLVTFDPLTGAVTDLGASVDFLDAIAFQPVPEPSSMLLLLGPAAFGLIKNVRRRRAATRAVRE